MPERIFTENGTQYLIKVVFLEKALTEFTKEGSLNETQRGDILFFTYDVTSEESFENTKNVFKFVQRGNDSAVMYLVGNFTDKGNRVISVETGKETVISCTDGYFREVSAKEGTGISELLDEAIHHFLISKTEKIVMKKQALSVVKKKGCVLL